MQNFNYPLRSSILVILSITRILLFSKAIYRFSKAEI